MIKKIGIVFSIILMTVGCSNPPSKAEKDFNDLKEDVFAQHDEMMQDMTTVNNLIQKLKPKIDSTDRDAVDYKRALERLKKAHSMMMGWMHTFDKRFPDINDDSNTYSDEEFNQRTEQMKGMQNILNEVGDQVNQSITYAQSILQDD